MVEFGCDNSHSAHVVSRLMQSHIVSQSSGQQQFVTQTKPKKVSVFFSPFPILYD